MTTAAWSCLRTDEWTRVTDPGSRREDRSVLNPLSSLPAERPIHEVKGCLSPRKDRHETGRCEIDVGRSFVIVEPVGFSFAWFEELHHRFWI